MGCSWRCCTSCSPASGDTNDLPPLLSTAPLARASSPFKWLSLASAPDRRACAALYSSSAASTDRAASTPVAIAHPSSERMVADSTKEPMHCLEENAR